MAPAVTPAHTLSSPRKQQQKQQQQPEEKGPLWEFFKYTLHGRKLVDARNKRTGVVSHRAWHQLDPTGVEPHSTDRYAVLWQDGEGQWQESSWLDSTTFLSWAQLQPLLTEEFITTGHQGPSYQLVLKLQENNWHPLPAAEGAEFRKKAADATAAINDAVKKARAAAKAAVYGESLAAAKKRLQKEAAAAAAAGGAKKARGKTAAAAGGAAAGEAAGAGGKGPAKKRPSHPQQQKQRAEALAGKKRKPAAAAAAAGVADATADALGAPSEVTDDFVAPPPTKKQKQPAKQKQQAARVALGDTPGCSKPQASSGSAAAAGAAGKGAVGSKQQQQGAGKLSRAPAPRSKAQAPTAAAAVAMQVTGPTNVQRLQQQEQGVEDPVPTSITGMTGRVYSGTQVYVAGDVRLAVYQAAPEEDVDFLVQEVVDEVGRAGAANHMLLIKWTGYELDPLDWTSGGLEGGPAQTTPYETWCQLEQKPAYFTAVSDADALAAYTKAARQLKARLRKQR